MSTSDSELPWARIESPGTGPRTCANLLMSTSDSELPWARIESPGTGPRTCANLLMSTSDSERLACRLGRSWTVPTGDQDPKARFVPRGHAPRIAWGATPRGRALVVCTGASVACRPRARIESPGTGPRTCADGPMSTSEASCHGRELSRAATRRELPGAQPPAPVTYLVLSCKKEKKGGKPRCSRKAFPGDGW